MNNELRWAIVSAIYGVQERMLKGCGNHGCRVKEPEGMATNGPCKCTAKEWARELLDIAVRLEIED